MAFALADVRVDHVDLEDAKTYELLQAGQTIGVFQLESPPMRALMRSMAPTAFEDVAALVALYRPGPMAANMHNDYADRKNARRNKRNEAGSEGGEKRDVLDDGLISRAFSQQTPGRSVARPSMS